MLKRKRSDIDVDDLQLAMAASCQTDEQRAIVLYDPSTKRQKVDQQGWLPSASQEEKRKAKTEAIRRLKENA